MEKDEIDAFRESLTSNITGLTKNIRNDFAELLSAAGIPIFAFYKALVGSITAVSDIFLMKKLYIYLFQIQETTLEERVRFLDKINNNTRICSDFPEYILSIIKKIDDIQKSDIVGYLSKQMILGNLEHEIGIRLIKVIETMNLEDINTIIKNDSEIWIKDQILVDNLSGLGVLTPWQMMYPSEDGFALRFKINRIGYKLDEWLKSYNKNKA